MSRIAPSIPVDLNSRRVLVESLASRVVRCDCCPGACVFCDEETRSLGTFNDTARILGPGLEVKEDSGARGPWSPVACWDVEGPRPQGITPGTEFFVHAPGQFINNVEAFRNACPISRSNLPDAELLPLTVCRVYFWQDPSQFPPRFQDFPVFIAAMEVFSGNPFEQSAQPVGWYVVQQFLFPTGQIFDPVWGFTRDLSWPFTMSSVTLLGCVAAGPGTDIIEIRLDG